MLKNHMSTCKKTHANMQHLFLMNTLHLALATLRCNLWVEWVPSDANCADVPSRPQGPEALLFYEKLGCKQWQGGMRFPTIGQIQTTRIGDVCQQR